MSPSAKRIAAFASTPVVAVALAMGTASPAHAETLSHGQLAGIVSSAGLPCVTGTAVALAESGGNTHATGAAGEEGIFQIHPTHGQSGMYDPYANAAYAAELHADQGWGPWMAHANGSYTRYLDDARSACGGASAPEPQPEPQPEPEPEPDTGSASTSSGSSGGSSGSDCRPAQLYYDWCDLPDLGGDVQPTAEVCADWKQEFSAEVRNVCAERGGGGGSGSYTVERGDTLSKIAAAHDTSWRKLYQANAGKIDDPNLIFPGQTLTV